MEDLGTTVTQMPRSGGLTISTTAVFIVGEIAGSGVLALPKAVEDTGWIGLVLIVACSLLSAYTGAILGKAWIIASERYDDCKGHVPDPYPLLGEKAYGIYGRYIVSFSINFTLFGVGTVFLLLASQNVQSLVQNFHDVSFCLWLIVLAAFLLPFTWLGTPKDFWPIAVGATVATSIACVLLITNVGLESKDSHHKAAQHVKINFMDFFMAFGTIVFAFGGHPAFPTFQTDMRKQSNFKWAVLLGYLIVLVMYFPVATAGYVVFGSSLKSNILETVCTGDDVTEDSHCKKSLTIAVQILITLHLLFGFVIVINPFCQEIESKFRVPKHFTWKRMVARTLMIVAVLFVAETIPHFGAILSLVGGSTTTLLAYVCPSLFYLKLCKTPTGTLLIPNEGEETDNRVRKRDEEEDGTIKLPLWVKVMNYEIIFLGITAGIASTVSAIYGIIQPNSFTVPCYVDFNKAG